VKLQPRIVVEVEPFGDARWARIERELFAKLDERTVAETAVGHELPGRRRPLAWAAAIAVVAAAASFAFVYPARSLQLDDRLRLATTDSTSQFTVGESWLTVAPRSLVMVSGGDEQGIDVVLDRGTVTCEVAPRRGRPPFVLDAGEVRVRVVGTKFTVTREESATSVDVEHGAVEVTARGVVTVLHDGDLATAQDVAPAPLAPPPGASEPLAPSPARSPSRVPRRRHVPALTSTTDSGQTEATQMEPTQTEPTPAEPTQTDAAPSAGTPSAQQAFEAAARRERTNPDEAAAGYRQITASRTAWAQIALFALARLESDRGHHAEAIRLFNGYLTRYPHGLNADDARELLRRMR
jgi:hypothetical protein